LYQPITISKDELDFEVNVKTLPYAESKQILSRILQSRKIPVPAFGDAQMALVRGKKFLANRILRIHKILRILRTLIENKDYPFECIENTKNENELTHHEGDPLYFLGQHIRKPKLYGWLLGSNLPV